VQSEAAVQMQEMLLLQQSNQQLHTMVAGLQVRDQQGSVPRL